jgi:hypothetical protein
VFITTLSFRLGVTLIGAAFESIKALDDALIAIVAAAAVVVGGAECKLFRDGP